MQTKQSEEPRALSLQEMEETNGGGCLVNMIGSGGGIVLTALEAANHKELQPILLNE